MQSFGLDLPAGRFNAVREEHCEVALDGQAMPTAEDCPSVTIAGFGNSKRQGD